MRTRWWCVVAMLAVGCGDDGPAAQGWDTDFGEDGSTAADGSTGGPGSGPGTGTTSSDSTPPTDTESGADESSTGDAPPDDPGDPFEPLPEPAPLPDAEVAALQSTLDGILDGGSLGSATVGALVVDLETEQVLYERNPDQVLVPASNTKMFTTAAAIDILGADARVETEVLADAMPDAGGTVSGNLYLMGRLDVSWSTDFYGTSRDPLDRIAEGLYDAGVRSVSGDVVAHGEFMYGGASLGEYNAVNYRATAVQQFRNALTGAGISVGGSTATNPSFDAPAGAVSLLRWRSPPMSSLSVPVNVRSHNEFADMMLRHLGLATDGIATYEAGGAQIVDWMASLPTDNAGASWNDGSGLNHSNRTSARNIVDLMRFMEGTAAADRWMRSMAIAGVRGTLAGRMGGPTTLGRFWGKTGTLPSIGVVSLSGILFHRDDGRRYAVSLLFNGAPNVTSARVVQNDFVTAVAANHHGVAGRPVAPQLLSARGAASDVVELAWTESSGVDGYAVWVSPDGASWDPADARRVDDTTFRAGDLPYSPAFVRVSAFVEQAGAVHSIPSTVFASTADVGVASVLVVDGNERWQDQPAAENPRAEAHGFIARYADAMPQTAFDTVAARDVADEVVDLADYDAVLWMLGEESDANLSFDALEQAVVAGYVEAGGALFVSGAEWAYDLGAVGTPEDAAFLSDVLHAGYAGDDAATWWMHDGSGPFADAQPLGFNTRDAIVVDFPDQLSPAGGGEAVLGYSGGAGGTAAVAWSGTGRTLVMGVPFESIEGLDDRQWVMARVLDFLQ
ncbi:MAG: D-alanyl-D-alanine carboxypeptidase [Myxococcota bacterium]